MCAWPQHSRRPHDSAAGGRPGRSRDRGCSLDLCGLQQGGYHLLTQLLLWRLFSETSALPGVYLSRPAAPRCLSLGLSLDSHALMWLLLPDTSVPFAQRRVAVVLSLNRQKQGVDSTRLNPSGHPHGRLFILLSKIISKVHLTGEALNDDEEINYLAGIRMLSFLRSLENVILMRILGASAQVTTFSIKRKSRCLLEHWDDGVSVFPSREKSKRFSCEYC